MLKDSEIRMWTGTISWLFIKSDFWSIEFNLFTTFTVLNNSTVILRHYYSVKLFTIARSLGLTFHSLLPTCWKSLVAHYTSQNRSLLVTTITCYSLLINNEFTTVDGLYKCDCFCQKFDLKRSLCICEIQSTKNILSVRFP